MFDACSGCRLDPFLPPLWLACPRHRSPPLPTPLPPPPLPAVGVLAACLFPLAPNWAKLGVVYLSTTLLIAILGTLTLRAAVALASWIACGTALWLLPNLLAEVRQRRGGGAGCQG